MLTKHFRSVASAPGPVTIITAVFLCLSIFYNFSLPVFEGYDEPYHFRVINHYANGGFLPDLRRAVSYEAHQPPLYYVIGAALVAPIDRTDFPDVYRINHGDYDRRVNAVDTDYSLLPSGTTLAVRVLRLFSALLGCAGLLFVYGLAKDLTQSAWAGVMAMSTLALNPKYLLLSSIISNDIAAIACTSAALMLTARFLVAPLPNIHFRILAIGAVLGLAILAKYASMALLPVIVLVALWRWWRDKADWRLPVLWISMLLAGLLAVAGWFFVYQWMRYGDPLAWAEVRALNLFSARQEPMGVGTAVTYVPTILTSFFSFVPETSLLFSMVWIAVAAANLMLAVRRTSEMAHGLALLVLIAAFVTLYPWMRNHGGTEDSRLMPAAFAVVSVMYAIPLSRVRWLSVIWLVMLLTAAIASPILAFVIRYPAAQASAINSQVRFLDERHIDSQTVSASASFTNGIELAGSDIVTGTIQPGGKAWVTVYWRVNKPVLTDYNLVVEAIDAQGVSLARHVVTPGARDLPTRYWKVGDIFREDYAISLDKTLLETRPFTVYVGWYLDREPFTVSPVAATGAASVPIGMGKVYVASDVTPKHTMNHKIAFGDAIVLEGYSLDPENGRLTLYWAASADVDRDFTLFLHVLGADGRLLTQHDGLPQTPTSLWRQGERFVDERVLDLRDNAAALALGWYSATDGSRLKVSPPDSSVEQNDALRIALP